MTTNKKAILRTLLDGAWHHAQELAKRTQASPMTIYRIINQLEQDGHVTTRTTSKKYGRPRKEIKLNPQGQKHAIKETNQ